MLYEVITQWADVPTEKPFLGHLEQHDPAQDNKGEIGELKIFALSR